MKKISGLVVVLLLGVLSAGCVTSGIQLQAAKNKAAAKVIGSQADTVVYDNEMYIARSRARHQSIVLENGEKAAVIKKEVLKKEKASSASIKEGEAKESDSKKEDGSDADDFDEGGYIDGLEVAFLNASSQAIRVRVDDPHGQFFSFTINEGETTIKRLEVGDFRVRSKRLHENQYRTDGTIRVFSDKRFHIDGGHYYGYAEFSGYGGW